MKGERDWTEWCSSMGTFPPCSHLPFAQCKGSKRIIKARPEKVPPRGRLLSFPHTRTTLLSPKGTYTTGHRSLLRQSGHSPFIPRRLAARLLLLATAYWSSRSPRLMRHELVFTFDLAHAASGMSMSVGRSGVRAEMTQWDGSQIGVCGRWRG